MGFSGHETFHIREGWLHKGLELLIEHPDQFADEYAHDFLGVGRNMSKSIKHWMVATGLATPPSKHNSGTTTEIRVTPFGKLAQREDPHFLAPGTWWALHANLVQPKGLAASWVWFFNRFQQPRFEKGSCLEALRRHLQMNVKRVPSENTLKRDVECLLRSYSKTVPSEKTDPEEAMDCPFSELRLMKHFRISGYYQLDRGLKQIPPEILGYVLSMSFPEGRKVRGKIDIPLMEASRRPGGPGKTFVMTAESLFNLVQAVEGSDSRTRIQIAGLAGQRSLRIEKKEPIEWLKDYYSAMRKQEIHVA